MFKKKINIAVVGATGYVGLDLAFLLSKHPRVNIRYLCAQKGQGKSIKSFDKRIKKKLPKISDIKKADLNNVDLLFLSLPNGEAQKMINTLYFKFLHLRFIDLSADFRLENFNKYKIWYNKNHKAKKLIKSSLYSISEFNKRKIKNFRIIANPGCYPTSIQLPLLPLLKTKLISKKNIIIDSKSGYSGAGKNFKKKFKHKNLMASIYAYGIYKHRHMAEIDQEIKKIIGNIFSYTFTPHLIPIFRGITTTMYLDLKNGVNIKKVHKFLRNFYNKSKFVKIEKIDNEIGSGDVIGTNDCKISVCNSTIKNKIIIISCIDNLVKGASGQAIQNMNLLFSFKEDDGLR